MNERQPTSKPDLNVNLPDTEGLTPIADIVKGGDLGNTYHRPDGKFISKHEQALIAEHADQIRDGLQEAYDVRDAATGQETSQDRESLEMLAELVAQARANTNEYSAHLAEDMFFNKFVELSDKYGWEENDGGPEAGVVFIDDDTEDTALDAVTIDDRLAYYAEVMYGADDSVEQSSTDMKDTNDDETDDFNKARAALVGYAEIKQSQADAAGDKLGDDEAESNDEAEADKLSEDNDEDEEATEASAELKAKHRKELDPKSLASAREALAGWQEVKEQVARHRSETWFSRARAVMNDKLTRLYYRAGNAINYAMAIERGDDESDEEYHEKTEKKGQIGLAVGIVAVGVAVGWGVYAKLNGVDTGGDQPPADGTFGGNIPLVPSPEVSPHSGGGGGGEIVQSALDNFSVPKGGNGEQVMAAAGRSASDWYNGLGDELAKRLPSEFTVIKPNQSIWIDRPGELSDAAIKIIDNWKR